MLYHSGEYIPWFLLSRIKSTDVAHRLRSRMHFTSARARMLELDAVLIRNYGLFWKRDRVFWGKPKVAGHLKGVSAKAARQNPIDFRDQQGVYVLYDDNFKIVYVGQSGKKSQRLFKRLNQHRSDALADRWTRFSWFGTRRVLNKGKLSAEKRAAHPALSSVLDRIEAILISATEPPHNRQGGRFGINVEQYLQYSDKALAPASDQMLLDIWKATKKKAHSS